MTKRRVFLIAVLILCGCAGPSTQRHEQDGSSATFLNATASADCQNTETSFRCVKVVEVYDGDTIFIDLPDQHPLFGKRMGVRIAGIDTPELKTKDACEKRKGKEAKVVLVDLLKGAKQVDIVDAKKDKSFRILGTVLVDGRPVADGLIAKNLAYPYHGEKKPKRNWCR